jgi:Tol biopolymer transport system component
MIQHLLGSQRTIALCCVAIVLCGVLQVRYAQATERVTDGNSGEQANGAAEGMRTNANGRFVVFMSFASNLVADDTNRAADVFVRDRLSGITERVSVNSEEIQSRSGGFGGSASADGRFVAFFAANLDPEQVAGRTDVFVRDRLFGTTRKVNVTASGEQANGESTSPAISSDGRFVAFVSVANNLLPNVRGGIFVHDLNSGTTERLSTFTAANGCGSPQLSSDGRFVAYTCEFGSTISVFVTDRTTQQVEVVSVAGDGTIPFSGVSLAPSIDGSGRFVAFWSDSRDLVEGDSNGFRDVFVRDRQLQTTELVSVGIGGQPASLGANFGRLSASGRFVVFQSFSPDLIDGSGTTVGDVYLRDRQAGVTRRVTADPVGNLASGVSGFGVGGFDISGDGSTVVYLSDASNLVPGDTNGLRDGFVQELEVPREFEPFAAFRAKVAMLQDVPFLGDQLIATGSFTVSSTGDGIDLATNDVKISLAGVDGKLFELEIPAGSFSPSGLFIFTHEAVQGSSGLLQISRSNAPNSFFFVLTARQPTLGPVNSPLTVSLQIGDDQGSGTIGCFGAPRLKLCE